MADFPALIPAARPLTPGRWGGSMVPALSGGMSGVRHSSAEIGRRLRLSFPALSEAEFLQLLAHYRGQRSGFDSFSFTTTTIPASYTPSGHQWLYASKPAVVDQHADVFSVECEFRSEPRAVIRAGGAELLATATLEPGVATGLGAGGASLSASASLAAGAATVFDPDPYFSSVALLLHFEGANNSTTFADSGPLGLSVTRQATSARITTAQAAIGSSSFDVNGDQLNLPSNSALTLDGDFTIEWRARHTSTSGKQQYFCNFSGTNVQIAYNSGLFFFPPNVTRTLSLSADTWAALAVTRSGSTVYWFKDGTLLGSATDSSTYNLSGGNIARSGSENVVGFLDEIRITKGVTRYTSGYTVRTTPFPDS